MHSGPQCPFAAWGCSSASLRFWPLSRLSKGGVGGHPAPRPARCLWPCVLRGQPTFIGPVVFARDQGGGAQVADSSALLNGPVEGKHPPVGEKVRPGGVEELAMGTQRVWRDGGVTDLGPRRGVGLRQWPHAHPPAEGARRRRSRVVPRGSWVTPSRAVIVAARPPRGCTRGVRWACAPLERAARWGAGPGAPRGRGFLCHSPAGRLWAHLPILRLLVPSLHGQHRACSARASGHPSAP